MDHSNELYPTKRSGELWQRVRLTLRLWLGLPGCPLVLQQHRMDCGLCCLAMVATFYSVPPSLVRRYLLEHHEFSLKGMTAAQMMQQAQRVGLTGQVRQLELTQLVRLSLPAILWWRCSHFVVLNRNCVRKQQAEILDPARGRIVMPWSQLQLYYSGISITLRPTTVVPSETIF